MSGKTSKYECLFRSGLIGTLELKNRLIMSPMGTRMASENGAVTQRMIDYYTERAKGGVAAVIVECSSVDYPLGSGARNNLSIYHNAYVAGHNELVEALAQNGAKAILQIYHVGRNARPVNLGGMQPVAPSAIPCNFIGVTPRELSLKQIEKIIGQFVQAAVRAKTAGYDGIELHGAHGYLIAQFMSPNSNKRKDRYGGQLTNRMTFPVEIIQGIRKQLGKEYPILFRLSGEEFIPDGMDLHETREAARILESAGVDAIDVSAGTYDSMTKSVEPMSYEEGWKIYMAESIKEAVSIPVIGVGVIRNPGFAEQIVKHNKVDFVALGRALLADPEWPLKAKEGREKEIIPCISCNDGCLGGRVFRDLALRCMVNPMTGREHLKSRMARSTGRKRTLVIGGGPSGMMAALTAHRRGHEVILFEQEDVLGGQMRWAAKPPGNEKIGWLLDYMRAQMEENNIAVRLGRPVDEKLVLQESPDAVIIATGAVPSIPGIPGLDGQRVCTARDVLRGKRKVTNQTVLIAGGGTVGCQTALFLRPVNEVVTVAEPSEQVAWDMEPINRMDLQERFARNGIRVRLGERVVRVGTDGVVLEKKDASQELFKADVLVHALQSRPLDDLVGALKNRIDELYLVGDSKKPRKIHDAIYEGFSAALSL